MSSPITVVFAGGDMTTWCAAVETLSLATCDAKSECCARGAWPVARLEVLADRACTASNIAGVTVDGQPWSSFSFNAAAGVLSISNLYDPAVPALTSPQPNSQVVCVSLKGTGTCAKSAGLCRRITVGGDCAVLAADAAGACCPVAEAPTYQAADGSVPLDRETSQAFNVTLQLNRKSATYTCAKLGASRADRRALFKRVAATYAAALGLPGKSVAVEDSVCGRRSNVLSLLVRMSGGRLPHWAAVEGRSAAILKALSADTGGVLVAATPVVPSSRGKFVKGPAASTGSGSGAVPTPSDPSPSPSPSPPVPSPAPSSPQPPSPGPQPPSPPPVPAPPSPRPPRPPSPRPPNPAFLTVAISSLDMLFSPDLPPPPSNPSPPPEPPALPPAPLPPWAPGTNVTYDENGNVISISIGEVYACEENCCECCCVRITPPVFSTGGWPGGGHGGGWTGGGDDGGFDDGGFDTGSTGGGVMIQSPPPAYPSPPAPPSYPSPPSPPPAPPSPPSPPPEPPSPPSPDPPSPDPPSPEPPSPEPPSPKPPSPEPPSPEPPSPEPPSPNPPSPNPPLPPPPPPPPPPEGEEGIEKDPWG
ncbi:hypothetical protein CHLRE_11g468362v5 [Chlamydomonas reinhardtii]|uniref:Pherophorin domain-containing protein n=1 Tax=Chlamydomonas reinhardtii TaxID=3055 RepID=A0A2K3D850_CHLRE|nr:uncharacterized protein CHLRE_11g468362v5 [Chlamydomonas reinhardtii]PNW76708.1 hypothetical protein CHLRE_11g468362v5 [Chlamydomonas reinhardtii]